MSKRFSLATTLILSSGFILVLAQHQGVDQRPANGLNQKPALDGQTDAPAQKSTITLDVSTAAEGLVSPWAIEFLPDGRMLVTEKPGRLRIVAKDGKLSEPVAGLPPVEARGQGGLLDVALDPRFATNHLIYWSYSERNADGTNNTAAARGKLVEGDVSKNDAPKVDDVQVIFHQTPYPNDTGMQPSNQHYGSRLVFGRDGTLFVTMGDRSVTPGRLQAQHLGVLIGKIARINSDGTIPKDNPFLNKSDTRPEIWSSGHRNVQSAALNPATGELWEVEHGTRGGDELNIARKGLDYGWPTVAYGIEYNGRPITGDITQKAGLEQPVYYWDPVIAPSGMMFYTGAMFPDWRGNLFVGGLEQKSLVRLVLKNDRVVGEERLLTDLEPRERIRDVQQGPDGAIYVVTDNPKGRVLRLAPKK